MIKSKAGEVPINESKPEVDESKEGAKKKSKSVYMNLADTEVHGEDSDGEFQRRVPITKKVNQEEVEKLIAILSK